MKITSDKDIPLFYTGPADLHYVVKWLSEFLSSVPKIPQPKVTIDDFETDAQYARHLECEAERAKEMERRWKELYCINDFVAVVNEDGRGASTYKNTMVHFLDSSGERKSISLLKLINKAGHQVTNSGHY